MTYTADELEKFLEHHKKWRNFDDETIAKMDSGGLVWRLKRRDILFKTIEISPCESTKKMTKITKKYKDRLDEAVKRQEWEKKAAIWAQLDKEAEELGLIIKKGDK